MAAEGTESQDIDLDRTDELPILTGVVCDDDVEDDAVPLDYGATYPNPQQDFPRHTAVDLLAPADHVRSMEERIARQTAEIESFGRIIAGARDAEAAAAARAQALGAEGQTLRDTLAARDATVADLLLVQAERDAQLLALQRDHAQIAPALEERSRAGSQLEAELGAARARSETLAADLQAALRSVADLTARHDARERELDANRRELGVLRAQASAYLERLRTREWRSGFDQNLLRGRLRAAGPSATEQPPPATEQPPPAVAADLRRLSDELAARTAAVAALTEENRTLRESVESARVALEEREFVIRRLERGDGNNTASMGRVRRVERSAAPASTAAASAPGAEGTAQLIRIDGGHDTTHTLGRRTRIGRAPGCELQIDSSSVSRHHALVMLSQRDMIIEDLNSTNGVMVNGRRVSRQLLKDGDVVTVGEAHFRFCNDLAPRPLDAAPTLQLR